MAFPMGIREHGSRKDPWVAMKNEIEAFRRAVIF